MNFQPGSGYDVALTVFRAIGVPTNNQNVPLPSSQGSITRPGSGSQWNSQPMPGHSRPGEETLVEAE